MTTKKAKPKKDQTNSRQRKRLFVDSKVQGSLVRQLILHWTLACFLIFFYLFAMKAFSTGFSLGFWDNLQAVWSSYGILALIMLVLSPVFIYDAMKLSNRFVGPMVSFRNSLRKLASGENPGPIHFREKDFWKDLTKDLNTLNEELRTLRNNSNSTSGTTQDSEASTVSQ